VSTPPDSASSFISTALPTPPATCHFRAVVLLGVSSDAQRMLRCYYPDLSNIDPTRISDEISRDPHAPKLTTRTKLDIPANRYLRLIELSPWTLSITSLGGPGVLQSILIGDPDSARSPPNLSRDSPEHELRLDAIAFSLPLTNDMLWKGVENFYVVSSPAALTSRAYSSFRYSFEIPFSHARLFL